jgi:hypothetical protein
LVTPQELQKAAAVVILVNPEDTQGLVALEVAEEEVAPVDQAVLVIYLVMLEGVPLLMLVEVEVLLKTLDLTIATLTAELVGVGQVMFW